jgi:hypothetical protein
MSCVGFLLIPGVGEIIGLICSLSIFIGFLCWGDKIILTFANAFLLKGKASLRQTISNQTCLLGMPNVELYIAHKHPNNIYYISSLFDSSIVIGRALFDTLDEKEVNTLVSYGVHKIKSSGARYASVCTLCFFQFFLPIFILNSLMTIKLFKIGNIVRYILDFTLFFYMPALMFNQFIMTIIHDNENFDRRFCEKTHLGHLLSSSLFKLETLRQEVKFSGSAFMLNQLSMSPDVNLEIIRDINFISNPFAERYKSVNSKRSVK